MDYETIWKEAKEAAKAAAAAMGERMQDGGSCGFAWVEIKPARGPLITWLKQQNAAAGTDPQSARHGEFGELIGYKPGWMIWNPGEYGGQNIDAKEAGAEEFVRILRGHDLPHEINSLSRLD